LRFIPQLSGGQSVAAFPFSIGRAMAAGILVGVGTKVSLFAAEWVSGTKHK
jgi:hypothetical protein